MQERPANARSIGTALMWPKSCRPSARLPPSHSMGWRVVNEAAVQAPANTVGMILVDGSLVASVIDRAGRLPRSTGEFAALRYRSPHRLHGRTARTRLGNTNHLQQRKA